MIEPARPVRVALHRLAYPLRRAHVAAHGREDLRSLILVEAELDDGCVGWGECSALARPTYTAEHTEGAWQVLRDELVPQALAGSPSDVVGHPMAAAGLRTALLDATLRRAGTPLAAALAGERAPAEAVAWTAVVARHDATDDLVAEVAERMRGRVELVKLKVTPQRADLAAVEAVRSAWPDLALAVDFNGTATEDALRQLDRVDLRYVEQPARPDDLVASARFADQISCPIALDESVASRGELDAAVALGAGAILNVKPARCGGPDLAVALAARAVEAGWSTFVGGMLESGVGRAAALAVAAHPALDLPTDLGPSLAYVDVDVTEPLELDDLGRMRVPNGPGIGVDPVPARLDAVTVDRLERSS